jgi:fructose-bisphosphate aldolase, class I
MMDFDAMRVQIARGQGFIAALDQSGGSTPKALKGYGHGEGDWTDDDAMFALIHAMRSRIISAPCFSGDKVIGAILFERTMDGAIDGVPVPHVLKARGVVPFIKIDKGLEDEADGVQLMKPIGGLDALLARAKALGVFGTKARSVINTADSGGIGAIVAQQFDVGQQVLAAGMVPILEPEVNIKSQTRDSADRMLLSELLNQLNTLPSDVKVMLKVSLPADAGLFQPLVAHPRCLRVVALSGGFARPEACAELAKNPGVIASFSRALLEDLRVQMDDECFDAALDGAIREIHSASVA